MFTKCKNLPSPGRAALIGVVICLGLLLTHGPNVSASNSAAGASGENASNTLYIPVVFSDNRDIQSFGFESNRALLEGSKILTRGAELDVSWARLGNRVSWKDMQANPGDPIDWSQIAQFEEELKALKSVGMTPLVIVQDYPHWAVESGPGTGWHGQPTSCGPLRAEIFDDFANFMTEVVNRYKAPMYNVHNWELGNEPDVDPDLLPAIDWGFGCWGRIEDPFYGGRHYGEMIKVVGQAIKAADPTATVWLGGLLLASPETSDPNLGKPELFLNGVLEAGAAPYFDVIGYHWYPPYMNAVEDYDILNEKWVSWDGGTIGIPQILQQILEASGKWASWGGGTIGKARFLRQTLDQYGVDKPVVLNETGLMCIEGHSYCEPEPVPAFYEMQADHLVRAFVRGLSEGVEGLIWYTLNGPGWRNTGLLDENHDPHEAYTAYQHLSLQLQSSRYSGPVGHGPGVEAYAFRRGNEVVQIVWSRANEVIPITYPEWKFIAAYDRAGKPVIPTPVGDELQLNTHFSPTFVVLYP